MPDRADISLLFDFFVTSQRLKRVLSEGLAESGMRPDEYAVYSLLFEKSPLTATEMAEYLAMPLTTVLDYLRAMTSAGHVVKTIHPFDGRAFQMALSRAGIAAHRRAHQKWEVVRRQIEEDLVVPASTIRRALRALDEAAAHARPRAASPARKLRT